MLSQLVRARKWPAGTLTRQSCQTPSRRPARQLRTEPRAAAAQRGAGGTGAAPAGENRDEHFFSAPAGRQRNNPPGSAEPEGAGTGRQPPQPAPSPGRALLPPLPHGRIPQRVSSAVRAASLLLWSNNFAWARLFSRVGRKRSGSAAPPPFISAASPGRRVGRRRQPAVRGAEQPSAAPGAALPLPRQPPEPRPQR